ncbi:MAG: MBL fold metallo-hydrolase [Chloroflexi bacterium]|nr:MBL fold metallo-hydrolase [Chloroflexota bacterium]
MTVVVPGIYLLQTNIPNSPLGHINSYLVQGDNGYLLVDTGWNSEEAFKSLTGQLAEIGVNFADIRQIVITHVHPDHYGLVGRLGEVSSARISLHPLEREIIAFRHLRMDEYLRQTQQWLRVNGVPPELISIMQPTPAEGRRLLAPALPDISVLQDGETISTGIFEFKVVWTPGHSPGHICLYEPGHKILLSGDHVIPGITPNISLSSPSGANPLGDFFSSLNKVKALDVNLVLPGHAQPLNDLPAAIEVVFHHHDFRIGQIVKSLSSHQKTAYEVSTELTWMLDEGGTTFDNLAPRNKSMAIMEALAHLEALRIDGRANKCTMDSTVYYYLA